MNDARRRSLTIAAVLVIVVCPSAASGQEECGKAPRGRACRMVIDYQQRVSGHSVAVENETPVTVVLKNKSPFDNCRNEAKREAIPDVSVVPGLIGALAKASGAMIVRSALAERGEVAPPPGFEEALVRLKTSADADKARVDEALAQYDEKIGSLKTFYATSYWKEGPLGHDPQSFEKGRGERVEDMGVLERIELPNLAATEAIDKKLQAEYAVQATKPGPAAADLKRRIDEAGASVEALSRAVSVFETARGKVRATLEYLAALRDPEWEAWFPVRSDRDAKVTGSVGCASEATGKATLDPPVVYTVVFGTAPRLSLTAGVLVSWVPRNSVGIESVVDTRTDHVVTTHEEIVEHPSSPQVVPFSFLNIRLPRAFYPSGHRVTINAAPGFGVNSNNGDVGAEFFAGGSVGIDSLYVAVGVHAGHKVQPGNGYKVGDRPPSAVNTVPLETPWAYGVSFAVSYRIPIK